jgi:uncharacterized membrane protein YkoI
VALILCGTSVPVTTGAAQSINLDIEINPDIIFKKGKSKREKQHQRRDRDAEEYRIKPSEAVRLVQKAYPGSKVLNVKALPGRPIYVVTLRGKTQVQRVRVNAITGAVSGGN